MGRQVATPNVFNQKTLRWGFVIESPTKNVRGPWATAAPCVSWHGVLQQLSLNLSSELLESSSLFSVSFQRFQKSLAAQRENREDERGRCAANRGPDCDFLRLDRTANAGCIKGLVQLEMKMWSSFTRLYVTPNSYCCLSLIQEILQSVSGWWRAWSDPKNAKQKVM